MAREDFNKNAPMRYVPPASGWETTYLGGNISYESTLAGIGAKARQNAILAKARESGRRLKRRGIL